MKLCVFLLSIGESTVRAADDAFLAKKVRFLLVEFLHGHAISQLLLLAHLCFQPILGSARADTCTST